MKRFSYPKGVISLVDELKSLPGIGPRSAERVAIWLLQHPKSNLPLLGERLAEAKSEIGTCKTCGFFTHLEECEICEQIGRESSQICVVEQPMNVIPLERSGIFHGVYHCLGGKLSPLDGVGPEDLRIAPLLRRVQAGNEVVLALSVDVEGEATSNYLAEILQERGCSVTQLAQGLPAGGGLEHADDLTLKRAFEGRNPVK